MYPPFYFYSHNYAQIRLYDVFQFLNAIILKGELKMDDEGFVFEKLE